MYIAKLNFEKGQVLIDSAAIAIDEKTLSSDLSQNFIRHRSKQVMEEHDVD